MTPTRKLMVALGSAAAVLVLGAPPALGADDGAVLQGTWSVEVVIQEKIPEIGGEGGTRTYRFGEGCVVGESCSVLRDTQSEKGVDTDLSPGGGGFTWSFDQALDCFDQVTGELSTKHGADYAVKGTLRPSKTEVRDGVTYVTALGGSIVETITVNAAGRADNCEINPAYPHRAVQRAVLTGVPVPLPAVPPGSSSDPVSVDPVAAEASGTIPEFRLERSDTAATSAEAVDAGRRSSVPGALTTPADAIDSVADRLPRDALLVALLGLLIVFPAQIFNSTYEENHDADRARVAAVPARATDRAVRGGGRRTRPAAPGGASSERAPWSGTVLGGLLDPEFGANRTTAALLVGVFVALVLAVLAVAAAGWAFRTARHQPHHWYLRAIPSALVVAVGLRARLAAHPLRAGLPVRAARWRRVRRRPAAPDGGPGRGGHPAGRARARTRRLGRVRPGRVTGERGRPLVRDPRGRLAAGLPVHRGDRGPALLADPAPLPSRLSRPAVGLGAVGVADPGHRLPVRARAAGAGVRLPRPVDHGHRHRHDRSLRRVRGRVVPVLGLVQVPARTGRSRRPGRRRNRSSRRR